MRKSWFENGFWLVCTLAVFLVLSGCSGAGSSFGGLNENMLEPLDDNGILTDNLGESSEDFDSDGSENSPTAFIPLPANHLQTEDALAYSADAESTVPVMVGEGGAYVEDAADADGDGEVDNYLLAISSDSGDFPEDTATKFTPASEDGKRSVLASLTKAVTDFFVPTVHADTHHIQYFPIKADGSVEAFYQFVDGSYTELYLAIVDNNYNVIGEVVTETVQDKLLYLADVPTGSMVAPGSGQLFSVTKDRIAEIALVSDSSGSRATVQGSHTDGYRAFNVKGRRAAFDGLNKVVSVVDAVDGVSFYDGSTGAFADVGFEASHPDATEYTFARTLEVTGSGLGLAYYSIAEESVGSDGKIYFAYKGTLYDDGFFGDIKFLDPDLDGVEHKRTLAFEMFESSVDEEVYASVVFRDEVQTYVYFAKRDNTVRFGIPLGDYPGIVDIRIVEDQPDKREFGTLALLDKDNSKVHFVKYRLGRSEANFNPANSIDVGNTPTAFTFNSARTRLYVAYAEGVKVFTNLTTTPTEVLDLKLSDVVAPEKGLVFKPNGIFLKDGFAMVTDENYKSAVSLSLEDDLTELSVEDGVGVGVSEPGFPGSEEDGRPSFGSGGGPFSGGSGTSK